MAHAVVNDIDEHIERYARVIDPGAWSLNGTCGRRERARAQARADVNDNEYHAGVAVRRDDKAGQWEHIARALAFNFIGMPQVAFDTIVEVEREKYIKGVVVGRRA